MKKSDHTFFSYQKKNWCWDYRNLHLTLPVLLSGVLLITPSVWAQQNSIEDNLFGGESQSMPLSSPAESQSSLSKAVTPESLTLGGRLELQSTLNKMSGQKLGHSALSTTTSAELYLDARPSDELRGYIKGAIKQSGSSPQSNTNSANPQNSPTLSGRVSNQPLVSVYETWIKWGGRGPFFTTLGRQKLKWGSATFWNPTDFLAVENKDPFATFDVRPGANLLKVHIPFEKSGHNLYLLTSLENSSRLQDPKFAARAEFNYGFDAVSGELSTTFAGGHNQPRQWGIDLNTALGPVDVIVESALTHGSKRSFYRLTQSDEDTFQSESYSRSKETIAQIVTGVRYDLKYSDSDSANISLEYFWNDFGSPDAASEAISFARGQAQRLYLAKKYLGASVLLAQPGALNDTTWLVSGLWNMSDKSWLARASWTEKLNIKSTLVIALQRSGGLGELTGGVPSSLTAKLIKSPQTADLADALKSFEDQFQEWTLSATAGIEL